MFFEFPPTAANGAGSIRIRNDSELDSLQIVAREALRQGATTVTFATTSSLGAQSIMIQLLPDRTYAMTSASFTLAERLVNASAVNFTATTP